MKKRVEISLDMDGVVANMDKAIYDKFGLSFPKDQIPDEDFKRLRESIYQGISNDPDFWIEIEPYEGYYEFYKRLQAYGTIQIVSAIPRHLSCYSPEAEMCRRQKTEWIRMHFGKEQSENVIVTKAAWKQKYISKSHDVISILVDDMTSNIENWKSCGGLGVHHTSFEDSLAQIRSQLDINEIHFHNCSYVKEENR